MLEDLFIDSLPLDSLSEVRDSITYLPQELQKLYSNGRNGAYLFGEALLIRPACEASEVLTIDQWNDPTQWKSDYVGIEWGSTDLCFAEDVFGYQFIYSNKGISHFDPETGESKIIAHDLNSWADLVLSDSAFWTGHQTLDEWNKSRSLLLHGRKLVAKTPFVCGGEFNCANLIDVSEVKSMKIRAPIASAIRNTPDGGKIRFTIVD